MTDNDFVQTVERLRAQKHEDASVEVKECAHRLSSDIWESVSAFANTEGGTIILGLSEGGGFAPVSGFDIDAICAQFISGMGDGGDKGRLANPPHYKIERHALDGSQVLSIVIDELEAAGKPCYIAERGVQNGSFKRVDDADIRLSANEVYALQSSCINTVADREPVSGASLSDLDASVCAQTFAKAQQLNPRALKGADTDEVRLKRLNLTDANGNVTKAGLLSAGCYPQQFFPKLHVDVAVHAGMEKSAPDGPRFVDRVLCEGTIGEMIDAAVSAILRNLRTASRVEGVARVDEHELPAEVLREAVANALIHREYDARFDGEAVAIDIFPDRVEVTNPGGLWNKSRRDLADGRSCCRNATLMKLMSLVPLPGGAGSPAEGNGSGIPLMMSECAKRGLREPLFKPAIDHFKVVLFRPSAADAEVARDEQPRQSGEIVLELLGRCGTLSARELAEKSSLSINQVRSRLKELLESGEVEATAPATSRNRRYRLPQA